MLLTVIWYYSAKRAPLNITSLRWKSKIRAPQENQRGTILFKLTSFRCIVPGLKAPLKKNDIDLHNRLVTAEEISDNTLVAVHTLFLIPTRIKYFIFFQYSSFYLLEYTVCLCYLKAELNVDGN